MLRRIRIAALIACAAAVSSANAQIVTFEDYPEGFIGSSFTDPATGIHFSNSTQGIFSIEESGSPAEPGWFDGKYLGGSAYSPGPTGSGRWGNFGFSANLPDAVHFISILVNASTLYSDFPGEVQLEAYRADGSFIALHHYEVTGFLLGETFTLSVNSPNDDIDRISLHVFGVFTAYDNIALVPEPIALSVIVFCPVLLRRQRSKLLDDPTHEG